MRKMGKIFGTPLLTMVSLLLLFGLKYLHLFKYSKTAHGSTAFCLSIFRWDFLFSYSLHTYVIKALPCTHIV